MKGFPQNTPKKDERIEEGHLRAIANVALMDSGFGITFLKSAIQSVLDTVIEEQSTFSKQLETILLSMDDAIVELEKGSTKSFKIPHVQLESSAHPFFRKQGNLEVKSIYVYLFLMACINGRVDLVKALLLKAVISQEGWIAKGMNAASCQEIKQVLGEHQRDSICTASTQKTWEDLYNCIKQHWDSDTQSKTTLFAKMRQWISGNLPVLGYLAAENNAVAMKRKIAELGAFKDGMGNPSKLASSCQQATHRMIETACEKRTDESLDGLVRQAVHAEFLVAKLCERTDYAMLSKVAVRCVEVARAILDRADLQKVLSFLEKTTSGCKIVEMVKGDAWFYLKNQTMRNCLSRDIKAYGLFFQNYVFMHPMLRLRKFYFLLDRVGYTLQTNDQREIVLPKEMWWAILKLACVLDDRTNGEILFKHVTRDVKPLKKDTSKKAQRAVFVQRMDGVLQAVSSNVNLPS